MKNSVVHVGSGIFSHVMPTLDAMHVSAAIGEPMQPITPEQADQHDFVPILPGELPTDVPEDRTKRSLYEIQSREMKALWKP